MAFFFFPGHLQLQSVSNSAKLGAIRGKPSKAGGSFAQEGVILALWACTTWALMHLKLSTLLQLMAFMGFLRLFFFHEVLFHVWRHLNDFLGEKFFSRQTFVKFRIARAECRGAALSAGLNAFEASLLNTLGVQGAKGFSQIKPSEFFQTFIHRTDFLWIFFVLIFFLFFQSEETFADFKFDTNT